MSKLALFVYIAPPLLENEESIVKFFTIASTTLANRSLFDYSKYIAPPVRDDFKPDNIEFYI